MTMMINAHVSKGGTGITNFDSDELLRYRAAIKEFGDSQLRIIKGAMGGSGLPSDYALHDLRRRKNLGAFWHVFNAIGEQS